MLKQAEEIQNKFEKQVKEEKFEENLMEENRGSLNFEDYIKLNAQSQDSFVFTRSQKMKFPLPVSEKLQIKVDLFLKELALPEKLIPTQKVEAAYDALRNNLILYSSLKKHLDKKQNELATLNKKVVDFHQRASQPKVITTGSIIPAINSEPVASTNSVTAHIKVKKALVLNKSKKVLL